MLTLGPELSNLDACEVRETPLTWRSTTGALARLSLLIIVRRAQDPRDRGHRCLWYKRQVYKRTGCIHSMNRNVNGVSFTSQATKFDSSGLKISMLP